MRTYLFDGIPETISKMVVPIKPIEHFKKAISLLQQNPNCDACLAYGRIAGWNYAFVETPLTVTAVWNQMLPKKIWVGDDAFVDKGETPEHMTRSQQEKIQQIDGVPSDPMAKGFDPFYFWKLPHPRQSEVFINNQLKKQELKRAWFDKHMPEPRKMTPQRYWGD
jgi:hypothetical protein